MSEKRRIVRRGEDRAMLEHFAELESLKCPYCDIKEAASKERWTNLHEEQKERQAACSSVIDSLKSSIETIAKSKADKDLLQEKASSIMKTLSILVGIFCLIVAGQAIWLRSDIKEIKVETQTIHRRITETDTNREALKDKLTDLQWSLNSISNRLETVEANIGGKQIKK